MACPCQKRRKPMTGRRVVPAPDTPKAKATAGRRALTAAAAVSGGRWATSCDPAVTTNSLLKAQRTARTCGGRVVPA